jgi:hypothetical protein
LLQNKNVSFEKSFGYVRENNWDGSTEKTWLVLQKNGAGSGKKIWVLWGV